MASGRKDGDGNPANETGSSSSRSLVSKKTSASKAFKLLENQGIIVGKTLGCGSYAKVKSAYDINRKQKVAIKMIVKKKASGEYISKFLPREIDCMRALNNHHALINSYQIVETTSRYFFVMELAENGDLLTYIKEKTQLGEDEAGPWFVNLYEGMKYMHGKGFVHRDIKCENLVISHDNILKITDFGFAKRIGKTKVGGPLLSETYCGSYAYAPPEILKGIPYDPVASDVWSMGVVLFTMVYGRLPFDDSDHKRLLKTIDKKIQFPPKPAVSKRCRILIVKILTKASERIPLRNMISDPWFKEQKALQRLDTVSRSNSTEATVDDIPVVVTDPDADGVVVVVEDKSDAAALLSVAPDVSNAGCTLGVSTIKVHSVVSHEVLSCEGGMAMKGSRT